MTSNLIPQSERTKEEQRAVAVKGGIASGKARREKKMLKDTLETLLAMPLKSGKVADLDTIRNVAALKGKNLTVQEAIIFAQVQKALRGDIRAAEFVRDTAGQAPTKSVDIGGSVPVVLSGDDDIED